MRQRRCGSNGLKFNALNSLFLCKFADIFVDCVDAILQLRHCEAEVLHQLTNGAEIRVLLLWGPDYRRILTRGVLRGALSHGGSECLTHFLFRHFVDVVVVVGGAVLGGVAFSPVPDVVCHCGLKLRPKVSPPAVP